MAEMLNVARRNLRQYIQKSGLIGPDKYSALACLDELEKTADAIEALTAAELPEAAYAEAISAAPHMSSGEGWQPIETAPKDGSMFICWVDAVRYDERDDGSFDTADCSEVDFCQWRASKHGGYFMNMMGDIGDGQVISHWQPLPPPPIDNSRSKP